MAAISAMFLPPIRVASDSGRSRAPPQLGTRAITPPPAQKDADVHLVLPPLQPRKEPFQAAELPLGYSLR